MKLRYNPVLVSAVIHSFCLLFFVPSNVICISTWRHATFQMEGYNAENLLMPLGFCFLGMEMIGLVVLWTGYRKKERWAWFVMLIILVCFLFGADLLPLLRMVYPPYFQWAFWFRCLLIGNLQGLIVPLAVLPILLMSIALLLPIKAFFGKAFVRRTFSSDPR